MSISICLGTLLCVVLMRDLADRKATIWNILVTVSEGRQALQGSQQQYSSLEVTVPSCISFIWTGKMALSYPHKRAGKRGPSGAESWRESTRTTHCWCYPESLCILETKKVSVQDFMFFRLLSFARSCSLENHLKYYKMYTWKEIWEIGTQILRCPFSTTYSEHSILTFILSSLYLVLQRSTERQAGNGEPAHSLTVCRVTTLQVTTTQCDRRIRCQKPQNHTQPSWGVQGGFLEDVTSRLQ